MKRNSQRLFKHIQSLGLVTVLYIQITVGVIAKGNSLKGKLNIYIENTSVSPNEDDRVRDQLGNNLDIIQDQKEEILASDFLHLTQRWSLY